MQYCKIWWQVSNLSHSFTAPSRIPIQLFGDHPAKSVTEIINYFFKILTSEADFTAIKNVDRATPLEKVTKLNKAVYVNLQQNHCFT